jgi:lysyl-tRNA synthetase class II
MTRSKQVRFEDQMRLRENEELMVIMDQDFLRALEYQYATNLWLIGMDRLMMFLTNNFDSESFIVSSNET